MADKVGRGYRVPKLEEFVQGFKFERKESGSWGIIDFADGGIYKKIQEWSIWRPLEVWWKHDPSDLIETKFANGTKLIQTGRSVNFFKPFDEQSFIDQKIVRVKIKK